MSEKIEGSIITIDRILKLLPHRYPFLLVDKVTNMVADESATGIKNVTHSEPWFTGHFAEFPVFPGVLIIEAIAQTSAILVLDYLEHQGEPLDSSIVFFMSVDKARFRQPVRPGDTMHIKVQKIRRRGTTYKFKGNVYVDDVLVAEAEIMAMNHEEGA